MPPRSGWIITGHIQKNTLRSYESVITPFCRDHGNRELEELTVDLVQTFLESITNGRKPQTRKIRFAHLQPYFGSRTFGEFNPVLIRKFVAQLRNRKGQKTEKLSAKRIQNIMIPLRVILRDAFEEYGWHEVPSPFSGIRLPSIRRKRVFPFSFGEWQTFVRLIPAWYVPYFQFAVQTGLRPL